MAYFKALFWDLQIMISLIRVAFRPAEIRNGPLLNTNL
jgi:hypothetical protein